ncbi:hypothetical protein [Aurantiacibacter luteus]|uniref:Lipoprotein n=1 Tax=Aurantiacibacter luteus TaxID=1581420 RepID=A0A0G9MVY3_9SPHN|nr:hypothetical protein [Aurantiacibacter luteus]KLE34719.1 hypothetical protein AAW00_11220 [Aurantiacibacter luteus]
MATVTKTVLLIACPLLLAGCGDDLASRNDAVMASSGDGEQEIVLRKRGGGGGSFGREPSAQPTSAGSLAEESAAGAPPGEGEPQVHDASPDDLVDTTEGFDPVPMDDGEGMADDWGG